MQISATELKARCLKLMDELARTGEPIVVTRRGRPVATLIPCEPEDRRSSFGYLAGSVAILGDIVAPLGGHWEADSQ